MHFWSHIPQDIRNFGPVYGYWCFSAERFNKTLKNMNTNSHIEQVPRTLMRTFQQYSHLDDLAACGASNGSAQGVHVSRMATESLDSTYRKWSRDTTHTKEQQWSAQWEQDRRSVAQHGASLRGQGHWPDIQLEDGQSGSFGSTDAARLLQVLRNSQSGTFIAQNASYAGHDPIHTFVVTARIQYYQIIRHRRRQFRSNQKAGNNITSLALSDLRSWRDSAFELRSPNDIYCARSLRCTVGIITKIFEHTSSTIDGKHTFKGIFMVYRRLKPFSYGSKGSPYQFER